MKKFLRFTIVLVLIFIIGELFLRYYYGFCDTVTMKADPDFEYIQKPNQNRFRFRNWSKYNSQSMRSAEVDSAAYIILGLGDSVLNGGVQTDQSELATTILTDTLSSIFNKKIQFLNVAAGSWGPDNAYEYLKDYGDFGAEQIIMVYSSHDAYDNIKHEKIIDIHPSYPSHQYTLAWIELIDRYLIPRLNKYIKKTKVNKEEERASLGINKKTSNDQFNIGFREIYQYCESRKIPITIYLHAEKTELKQGKYNDQGQEIIEFAKNNDIELIKDLEHNLDENQFRDGIHLNAKGQRQMAMNILEYLEQKGL